MMKKVWARCQTCNSDVEIDLDKPLKQQTCLVCKNAADKETRLDHTYSRISRGYRALVNGSILLPPNGVRDGIWFDSKMEANLFRYYLFLKKTGGIIDFKYQPQQFDFNSRHHPSYRRLSLYTPDFFIQEQSSQYYVESKGYWDQDSITKVKRFQKIFTELKLVIIEYSEYKIIEKDVCKIISNWE